MGQSHSKLYGTILLEIMFNNGNVSIKSLLGGKMLDDNINKITLIRKILSASANDIASGILWKPIKELENHGIANIYEVYKALYFGIGKYNLPDLYCLGCYMYSIKYNEISISDNIDKQFDRNTYSCNKYALALFYIHDRITLFLQNNSNYIMNTCVCSYWALMLLLLYENRFGIDDYIIEDDIRGQNYCKTKYNVTDHILELLEMDKFIRAHDKYIIPEIKHRYEHPKRIMSDNEPNDIYNGELKLIQ